jgi:chemotaxis protein MotB
VAQKNDTQVIIIRKKVKGHGGHHGGAWKVAYADFVTAMMALFIVLWLLASSAKVKAAVADYFVDPTGKKHLSKGGNLPGSGTSMAFSTEDLKDMKAKIQKSLSQLPDFKKMKDQVEMTITAEGLRIELLENPKGVFFESGKPHPTQMGLEIIGALANKLGAFPNHILVEGHTDSAPFGGGQEGYSNWELSTDRAHAARKIMQQQGIRADQIKEVRGFADQHLRNAKAPTDPSNRRISVIVQYRDLDEKAIQLRADGSPVMPGARPAPVGDTKSQANELRNSKHAE